MYRNVEQCHYTYVTKYRASQEEVCQENYEKVCRISYASRAVQELVRKCYRPVQKVGTKNNILGMTKVTETAGSRCRE